MTDLVPVTPTYDFSGITFSQSKTGHVHSPWWTYDWRKYDQHSPYTIGSHFHNLRRKSEDAFAYALGLRSSDVISSQRENPETGELEWRIGTIHPCHLPQRKVLKLSAQDAIDI